MKIRKLADLEIDIAVKLFQAMLDEMTSFGGDLLQGSLSDSHWLRDSIRSQIEFLDRVFLVAELNAPSSQLIGILEASIVQLAPVFLPKSSLDIYAIYVVPEHRRSGVARSLMEAALKWGQDSECTEATLNVLLRNLPARALYKSLGFEDLRIEMQRSLTISHTQDT
jgi:ribosomal protein S18 acetylase RimI-like enzyme